MFKSTGLDTLESRLVCVTIIVRYCRCELVEEQTPHRKESSALAKQDSAVIKIHKRVKRVALWLSRRCLGFLCVDLLGPSVVLSAREILLVSWRNDRTSLGIPSWLCSKTGTGPETRNGAFKAEPNSSVKSLIVCVPRSEP